MRIRYWIIIGISYSIILLLIGNLIPARFIDIEIDLDKKMGVGDVIYYSISFFAMIGTFLAVVVALFKEQIVSLFRKVEYSISLSDDGLSEDVDEKQEPIKSKMYSCDIMVTNKGNIAAFNSEIAIKKIECGNNIKNLKEVKLNKECKLLWDQEFKECVIPGKGGQRIMNLFCIYPSKLTSVPGQDQNKNVPPRIKFNGILDGINVNSRKGAWVIEYVIYTKGEPLREYKLTVEWDNIWKDRKTEMINNITISLV